MKYKIEFKHGRLDNFNVFPYIVFHWNGFKHKDDYRYSLQFGWLVFNFGFGLALT